MTYRVSPGDGMGEADARQRHGGFQQAAAPGVGAAGDARQGQAVAGGARRDRQDLGSGLGCEPATIGRRVNV